MKAGKTRFTDACREREKEKKRKRERVGAAFLFHCSSLFIFYGFTSFIHCFHYGKKGINYFDNDIDGDDKFSNNKTPRSESGRA